MSTGPKSDRGRYTALQFLVRRLTLIALTAALILSDSAADEAPHAISRSLAVRLVIILKESTYSKMHLNTL